MKQRDWFSTRADRGYARPLKRLRYGKGLQVTTACEQVAATHGFEAFRRITAQKAQLGAEIRVCLNPVFARIGTCNQSCAVDFRCADERGMIAAKKRAVRRQRIERGTMLWCDEVRSHAIPDDDDDVFGGAIGFGRGGGIRIQRDENEDDKGGGSLHKRVKG